MYVGMTMVKREQRQDDYSSQQNILLTLPAYISATDYQRTYDNLVNVRSTLC